MEVQDIWFAGRIGSEFTEGGKENAKGRGNSKYRPEIDGMRAFAVVAVIINHFNNDLLPSGYLGVDIFFVISGYVITSSLADRESKNFLDFITGFYERRLKRLVPALVVFVLITSILISMFNPDPKVQLGLGWRSLFGISNINLYRGSTDYFAESSQLNPFTHTWSLGVEEQFYLLFPFLIWFSGFGQQKVRGALNLFFLIGALTVTSLVSFIYLSQVNQPAAYFLMPARFWEMAAGCMIFIGFQKRARIEQALEQVPPLLVVGAMVFVMFFPTSAAVPATISIVVLSVVQIACLKKNTFAYRLFTHEKVVYVGLISYSLYLWHWGVLCISRWTIGIHWWSVPLQICAIFLLSILSYHLIESPARRSILLKSRLASLGTGSMLTFFGFLSVHLFGAISNKIYISTDARYESEYAALAINDSKRLKFRKDVNRIGSDSSFDNCHLAIQYSSASFPEEECSIKGVIPQTIFFVGNSHSENLRPLQSSLAKASYATVYSISVSSCTFPSDSGPSECKVQNLLASRIINLAKNGDLVVINNRYPLINLGQTKLWTKDQLAIARMENFLIAARKKKVNVVLFAPTPEFKNTAVQCIPAWYRLPELDPDCTTPKIQLLEKRRQTYEVLAKMQAKGALIFDPMPFLCPESLCSVIDYRNIKILYPDGSHLSDYSVRSIIKKNFFNYLRKQNLVPSLTLS